MSSWVDFVAQAVHPPPDDPYVRLLRERLAHGCRVVRAHALVSESKPLEYLIILDCAKQLSEMRVPHSEAFTRWSIEAGARMSDPAEEAARFSRLLDERLARVAQQVDRHYFLSVLVSQVRRFEAETALKALGTLIEDPPAPGPQLERTRDGIVGVLATLAELLGGPLAYPDAEAASVLDHALALYLEGQLHLSERRELLASR